MSPMDSVKVQTGSSAEGPEVQGSPRAYHLTHPRKSATVDGAAAAGFLLLVPYSGHRIDSRRSSGGHVTSQKHCGDKNRNRETNGNHIIRFHAEEKRLDEPRGDQADGHTDREPCCRQRKDWRNTMPTTSPRCAPSAIRIPISPVRRATVYAIVPYKPTQAMSNARTAKAVQSLAKMISWFMV